MNRLMPSSEELRFSAGSITLAATITLPAGSDLTTRPPSVLLLPSFLPRDRDGRFDAVGHPDWFDPSAERGLLARLAEALASVGVASLRYDKRGCGLSDGTWTDADLFTLIDDARDAIAFLRSRGDLDPTRMGLLGHGEGGLLAMSTAAADPALSGLALIGVPARSWRDSLRWGIARRGGSGPPFVRALDRGGEELIERVARGESQMRLPVGSDRVTLGLRGWQQTFGTPGMALASLQDRSASVWHGQADVWINPDESGLLSAALPMPTSVAATLIPQAGHDLEEADDRTILAIASDLAAHLEPRALPTHLLSIDGL
jgi:hypothetical protein